MVNITVIIVIFIFMSSSFYTCLIPRDAVVKNPPTNAGDVGLVLGLGRSPAEGNISSLQYSCLENPHGQRSLADYNPWGHRELDMTEHTHTHTHTHTLFTLAFEKLRHYFPCEKRVMSPIIDC